MASTLVQQRTDTQMAMQLAEMKEDLEALKSDQVAKVIYGDNEIVIDGTTNNPSIKVGKNNAGQPLVVLDTTGLTVTNGNNTATLNGNGVISSANFNHGTHIAASTTTNSTSFVDVDSGINYTTTSEITNILVSYSGLIGNAVTTDFCQVTLWSDGNIEFAADLFSYSLSTCGNTTIISMGPGNHTLKLQMRTSNGANTATVDFGTITYIFLGN